MERQTILVLAAYALTCIVNITIAAEEKTILSTILKADATDKLNRQSRSYYDYYDYRYGIRPAYDRPIYDRLEYARLAYDRPRCGRCDDRYDRDDRDDSDDYDRRDDDRRGHRPTHGNRYDKKNYDSDEDRYDRKNSNKNATEEENGDKKHDDKDRPSGSRRGSNRDRDRDRERDRNRHDDRDRYRPDYYDRFLRDRDYYDRPYDDFYRDRRPLGGYYDRYDGFGSYGGYGNEGYRRPGLDEEGYGGYGPSLGRGPHDSFRPWDETYRGQAGWDAGGRGYYFASGRPDAAPASAWGRPEYARPQSDSGWQNLGYAGGYRAPQEYRGSAGYSPSSYRQDLSSSYGQASGWHSVGERRPYRDESGVKKLDNRDSLTQPSRSQNVYVQSSQHQINQQSTYGQPDQQKYGQSNFGQNNQQSYGQPSSYGQGTFGQQPGYGQSSTTPGTSYLFQRADELVTGAPETTKSPS